MRPTVVKKHAEQAHRRRARDPVPSPPHPTHLGKPRRSSCPSRRVWSSHLLDMVHLLPQRRTASIIPRTTESSLGTASSARSKSPRSFSTRTRRPRQWWVRTIRCSRRAGHQYALPVRDTISIARPLAARTIPDFSNCSPQLISYTHLCASRSFLLTSAPLPLHTLCAHPMSR